MIKKIKKRENVLSPPMVGQLALVKASGFGCDRVEVEV